MQRTECIECNECTGLARDAWLCVCDEYVLHKKNTGATTTDKGKLESGSSTTIAISLTSSPSSSSNSDTDSDSASSGIMGINITDSSTLNFIIVFMIFLMIFCLICCCGIITLPFLKLRSKSKESQFKSMYGIDMQKMNSNTIATDTKGQGIGSVSGQLGDYSVDIGPQSPGRDESRESRSGRSVDVKFKYETDDDSVSISRLFENVNKSANGNIDINIGDGPPDRLAVSATGGKNENAEGLGLYDLGTGTDGGVTVGGGVETGGDEGAGIGMYDENNYQTWNRQQVLMYLKDNLIANGMSENETKSFLKEFAKKRVTGGVIQTIKNDSNDQLFNQLKSEFSQKNQAFGIWVVVKTCFKTVGQSTTNGKATSMSANLSSSI